MLELVLCPMVDLDEQTAKSVIGHMLKWVCTASPVGLGRSLEWEENLTLRRQENDNEINDGN